MGNWKRRIKKDRPKSPMSEFFSSKSKTPRAQELRIRDDFKAKRVSVEKGMYLAQGIRRADVLDKEFLFEAKQTERKSFALSQKILSKIDSEATNHGKVPAIVVQFKSFPFSVEREWVVIPYVYLKMLIQKLREKKNE